MVRVAIVGCAHGKLDEIYDTVRHMNEMDPVHPIRLLLCCGDFQSMRNNADLETMACPPKYRALNSFHEYYAGKKTAPVLTAFIGGNHEASNYLMDLRYGGWVAPRIFFLGFAGVIRIGGLRIAGLSGIFKPHAYHSGHFETMPLDQKTMRSVYHIRQLEIYRLSLLQHPQSDKIDIFLSHDWPRGVEQYGDVGKLVSKKPFFRKEIQANTLGNPATEYLLHELKPLYWFAAHLHVKFAAIVPQNSCPTELESDSNDSDSPNNHEMDRITSSTRFLALDKCLPGRDFLQVLEFPDALKEAPGNEEELLIKFDAEWLAILKATYHLETRSQMEIPLPNEKICVGSEEIDFVYSQVKKFKSKGSKWPNEWITEFVKTVPTHEEEPNVVAVRPGNPQTDTLLAFLELQHVVTVPYERKEATKDPNAITLDDEEMENKETFNLIG
nr:lariat debranching enzyme B putative [Albugo laibachii Nc14]|eukprot:CCA24229.1 lariat debranching enzyme B putative [Albugo laibachii Nc14]